MAEKYYLDRFEEEYRIRVEIETERGQVLDFIVQLECFIGEIWYPVVRYNCAHGTPHRDVLHPDGSVQKEWYSAEEPSEVLTRAIQDIKANYAFYKERYEKERRR